MNAFEGPERREKPWSLTGPTDCVQEPSEASREVVSQEASPEPLPASTPQHSAFDQSWWARGTLENGRAGEDLNAAGLSTAPFLTLSALLVVAFSTVTLVYLSQPAHLDRLLRAIPLLGSSIFKNNHLKDGMALQSVTARVQTIRGNREVFTISGQVHNHNTVSVREVRLEGYVYNADGKELGRQVISVGNPISERIIRDVEPKELSILQELSPQRRFEILPEQWVPFIIVFLKAKEISSFGYRVLSAAEVG